MGKSSNKKKARKAEKAKKVVVQKKSLPKRKIVIIMLAVLIIGLGIYIYPQINASLVLRWDKDKILSSPEKSLRYAQVVLRELVPLIPAEVLAKSGNTYSGHDTIKTWMEKVIEQKLPQQIGLIAEAKEWALKGEPIELEWMPDRHTLPTNIPEEQARRIEDRQKLHIDYIQKLQPEIIFAEGLHIGQISSQRLRQDLKDVRKLVGEEMNDAQAESESQKRNKDYWWRAFIDKEKPKLFGIEDRDIVALGTFIILANYEMVRLDKLRDLSSEFQYYWREQIVLSNIILALRKEGAHKASLVFGEDHVKTFSHLCALWGVKLKIAD